MNLKKIFSDNKTIAVYGMSKSQGKPSNYVPMFLLEQGYKIVPINPTTDEISGLKCYNNLNDVPDNIDILNVFRPSEQALGVVKEAVERKKTFGDIKVIWLQEGIISSEAQKLAEAHNIEFIQDRCMLKEYKNQ